MHCQFALRRLQVLGGLQGGQALRLGQLPDVGGETWCRALSGRTEGVRGCRRAGAADGARPGGRRVRRRA